jgi:hypothetical protein
MDFMATALLRQGSFRTFPPIPKGTHRELAREQTDAALGLLANGSDQKGSTSSHFLKSSPSKGYVEQSDLAVQESAKQ